MPWDRLVPLPCLNRMTDFEDERDTAHEGYLETQMDEHRSYMDEDAPTATQFEYFVEGLAEYVEFCRDGQKSWRDGEKWILSLHTLFEAVLLNIYEGGNIRGQITELAKSKTLRRSRQWPWRD